MPGVLRWIMGAGIAVLVTTAPLVYYRAAYANGKRLREVVPGVLYRSGQLTAAGFSEAVDRHHIRTIINLQDEYPDPDIEERFFGKGSVKESDLCRSLGARYFFMPPDLLPRRHIAGCQRPATIERFLAVMDDPANYPVLIHCRAGLHRTGVIAALYRMEYQGWSPLEAVEEMRANGFDRFPCTSANEYVTQYILSYQPGLRVGEVKSRESEARSQGSGVRSQGSGVRGQESGVRGQESGVRSQEPPLTTSPTVHQIEDTP